MATRKYDKTRLDLHYKKSNETLEFYISDTDTSDFYIRLTRANMPIKIDDLIIVLCVIDPSNQVRSQFMSADTNKEGFLYCKLEDSMKSQIGVYQAKVMLVYEDEKIVTDTFTYTVKNDMFVALSQEIIGDERFETLNDMLSEISRIKNQEEDRVVAENGRVATMTRIENEITQLTLDINTKVNSNVTENTNKTDDLVLGVNNAVNELVLGVNAKVDNSLNLNTSSVNELVTKGDNILSGIELNSNQLIASVDEYKNDVVENIETYKVNKDSEINQSLTDYKISTTESVNSFIEEETLKLKNDLASDSNTYKESLNAEFNKLDSDLRLNINNFVADKSSYIDTYLQGKSLELTKYINDKNIELNTYINNKNTELNTYKTTKNAEIDKYFNDKNTEFNNNEKTRVSNESRRETNEYSRGMNENNRKSAEDKRISSFAQMTIDFDNMIKYNNDTINSKYDDIESDGITITMKANGVAKKTITLSTGGGGGHTHLNKTTLDKITEDKLTLWNNKVDSVVGKGLSDNNYTTEEKMKLDGIEENSNNYTHPSTHSPAIILQDSNNRFVSDIEKAKWNNKSSFSGSYDDLINKPIIPSEYTLPVATESTLGGVKVGAGLTITAGVLSASGGGVADSVEWSNVQNKPNVATEEYVNNNVATLINDDIEGIKNVWSASKVGEQFNTVKKKLPKLQNKLLENATNFLNIPTYDGSNQLVHSKVLYFENGWNGYKFWMAFTPLPYYPSVNEDLENPSIVVSNDSINWVVPDGLINPLDNITTSKAEYNSDTHLVMNGDVMEIWYRHFLKDTQTETIYKKTSSNGIDWSDKIEIIKSEGNSRSLLSPVVIYDEDKYKVWFISTTDSIIFKLRYYESSDGINLMFIREMELSEKNIWHHDIIKTKYGYELVANTIDRQKCIYSKSSDNLNWDECTTILNVGNSSSWDCDHLYRPNLTVVGDDYYLFYTGRNDSVTGAKQGRIIIRGYNDFVIQPENVIENNSKMFVSKQMYNKLNILDIESILSRISYLEKALESGSSVVNATSISLDLDTLNLKEMESHTLVATILPENVTNSSVSWSSNNDVVATVDGGKITALSSGQAIITASTHNSIIDTCVVTVYSSDGEIYNPTSDGYMPFEFTGTETFSSLAWNNNETSDYIVYQTLLSKKVNFISGVTSIQDMLCNKIDVYSADNVYKNGIRAVCGSLESGNKVIQFKLPVDEVGGRTLSDFNSYLAQNNIVIRTKTTSAIERIILSGNENWSAPGYSSVSNQCLQFELILNSNLYIEASGSTSKPAIYSSKFKTYKFLTDTVSKNREGLMSQVYGGNNILCLSIDKNRLESYDVNGLKKYLSNSNLIIYVPLI